MVANQSGSDIDLNYLSKRMLPLLVQIDKTYGTSVAKAILPVIKGVAKEKS